MTLLFFAILVVVNSAIWTYFDAARLRDAHHTGVGPMGRPPQAWSALVFFAWPVAFPLYLSKVRDEARSQPMRPGTPPLFESPGLNAWGYLSMVVFSGGAVAALLYFDRPRWALASLVCMVVGVFGGRKSVQSGKEQRFDLGGAAWDMKGFRPVDDDGEDGGEAVGGTAGWSGGTDLPPVADRQGNFKSAAARPGEGGDHRPNLPRDVFSAPNAGEAAPAPGDSASSRAEPAASSPSHAEPAPPPAADPASAERPPQRPVVATDTRRLAEKARRLRFESGEGEEWELDEEEAPPPPPPPSPSPQAADTTPAPPEATAPSQPASPAAEPPPAPQTPAGPATPARPRSPDASAPSRPSGSPRRPTPQPGGGAYGGYAASSRSGGGVNPLFFWLGGIVLFCLAAWLWSSGVLGGGDAEEALETPVPAPVAATPEIPQATGNSTSGDTTVEPEVAEDPRARLEEEMDEWIETYDRLMEPIAKRSEEVDFDGFSREACRELTRGVQVASVTLPEAPDEEVERLLRPAFRYLESTAEACEREQETAWSSSLLRAKDHTHEAQVLMDERYQYSGFLELEQESAIGVTRPTSSMSGRYLAEQGGG